MSTLSYREEESYEVGEIPEALRADDGLSQVFVQQAINFDRIPSDVLEENFLKSLCQSVPLSTLRREYQKDLKRVAMKRLASRHRVTIDEVFLHQSNDPMLAWSARHHYLDFFMLVSGMFGIVSLNHISRAFQEERASMR